MTIRVRVGRWMLLWIRFGGLFLLHQGGQHTATSIGVDIRAVATPTARLTLCRLPQTPTTPRAGRRTPTTLPTGTTTTTTTTTTATTTTTTTTATTGTTWKSFSVTRAGIPTTPWRTRAEGPTMGIGIVQPKRFHHRRREKKASLWWWGGGGGEGVVVGGPGPPQFVRRRRMRIRFRMFFGFTPAIAAAAPPPVRWLGRRVFVEGGRTDIAMETHSRHEGFLDGQRRKEQWRRVGVPKSGWMRLPERMDMTFTRCLLFHRMDEGKPGAGHEGNDTAFFFFFALLFSSSLFLLLLLLSLPKRY